jgi:hypothetical protein
VVLIDCKHIGHLSAGPVCERGGFELQPATVGADLQHAAPPVGQPASNDYGRLPAWDRHVERQVPLVRDGRQERRQVSEPRLDLAAEASCEALPRSLVDLRDVHINFGR